MAPARSLEEIKRSVQAVLTVRETAEVMRVDDRTVRRACDDGQLPCIRVGRRILIPRGPLIALLEGGDAA